MKNILKAICAGIAVMSAATAFAKESGGKISATLFDGQGNKEVLAEATYTPREPAPAPQQQPQQQPQVTTSTLTDGKGTAIRTVETKGDTTTVKDGKGRVVRSTTRNADGSTTTRDGTGRIRETSTSVPAGK